MALIEPLLEEIDRRWEPVGSGKLVLPIIGSAALMLQASYSRGTKDGDVLETSQLTEEVKDRLLRLAGRRTEFHQRFGIYLDVVVRGLPLLPQKPLFHQVARLAHLKHLDVRALDIVDVVVSKLKRFNADDDSDIRAMAALGLVPHRKLVERFEKAIDRFLLDSRAEDLPKVIVNLHRIERDYLGEKPSKIELPDWIG